MFRTLNPTPDMVRPTEDKGCSCHDGMLIGDLGVEGVCWPCWRRSQWAGVVSALGDRVRDASFDSENTPCMDIVREWHLRVFPRGAVYMSGNPGCGKTYAAAAACRHAIQVAEGLGRVIRVEAWRYPRWATRLSDYLQSREWMEAARMKYRAEHAGLLVLDDFGYEELPTYMQGQVNGDFQEILKARYEGNRATIITSNRSLPDLGKDENHAALVSRLKSWAYVVHDKGQDRRETGR